MPINQLISLGNKIFFLLEEITATAIAAMFISLTASLHDFTSMHAQEYQGNSCVLSVGVDVTTKIFVVNSSKSCMDNLARSMFCRRTCDARARLPLYKWPLMYGVLWLIHKFLELLIFR